MEFVLMHGIYRHQPFYVFLFLRAFFDSTLKVA